MNALTGKRRLPLLAAVGLVVAFLLICSRLSGGLELTVSPVKGGPALLVVPLQPGERFTLHYYHSVENSPIWEEHSLDAEGRIFVEEERYVKFGAGMGRMPGVGRMVRRGDYEVIENMQMPTGNFVLRIGSPGVDHTVIWRGRRTNLSAVAPHVAVQFAARPVSLLYRWWRQLLPHAATPR
ncbi:MAG: DUF1850 domain-containing protein [Deltaproteobacteria bacterium]|jgi:hypothetical protein|nr:DUF1850 domain-containing protein [Deltaproteobacteria bacterium]MBW2487593.1 DUF1850 domain-containing protein [Deltaproteobacteria bacterium]